MYTPFHMMYNRDSVTPFELADNQMGGNPVLASLSGELMTMLQRQNTFTCLNL